MTSSILRETFRLCGGTIKIEKRNTMMGSALVHAHEVVEVVAKRCLLWICRIALSKGPVDAAVQSPKKVTCCAGGPGQQRDRPWRGGGIPAGLQDCNLTKDVCLLQLIMHIMEHLACTLCHPIDGSLVNLQEQMLRTALCEMYAHRHYSVHACFCWHPRKQGTSLSIVWNAVHGVRKHPEQRCTFAEAQAMPSKLV